MENLIKEIVELSQSNRLTGGGLWAICYSQRKGVLKLFREDGRNIDSDWYIVYRNAPDSIATPFCNYANEVNNLEKQPNNVFVDNEDKPAVGKIREDWRRFLTACASLRRYEHFLAHN